MGTSVASEKVEARISVRHDGNRARHQASSDHMHLAVLLSPFIVYLDLYNSSLASQTLRIVGRIEDVPRDFRNNTSHVASTSSSSPSSSRWNERGSTTTADDGSSSATASYRRHPRCSSIQSGTHSFERCASSAECTTTSASTFVSGTRTDGVRQVQCRFQGYQSARVLYELAQP